MRSYFSERAGESTLYTDLAVERHRVKGDAHGIEYTSEESAGGVWERVRVFSPEGERAIGRPMGKYHTFNTGRLDLLYEDEIDECCEEIARKLCEAVDGVRTVPDRILVIGLGNEALTPDSVGPKTAKAVKPTMHVRKLDEEAFETLGCSEIAVLCPGVTATTGVDSLEVIRGVVKRISPDLIIAVDSLATMDEARLGSTVQISDTGIFPGSGVGNYSHAISEDELGIPIISVGVPTVIDSRAFRREDGRRRSIGEAMLVAPREIDEITTVAGRIIGGGINQAFGISPY